jgi:hypothetical protein
MCGCVSELPTATSLSAFRPQLIAPGRLNSSIVMRRPGVADRRFPGRQVGPDYNFLGADLASRT